MMVAEPGTGPGRGRLSIEKRPIDGPGAMTKSAFDRLPDEIIQQILLVTDPDSFASLVLLDSKWRRVSQQAHLYAHHLSRCPSFAASHKSFSAATAKEGDLPRLRRLFAREVKRNLFEAYLRPSETVITLVSNSISASSCPGGEGLQFSSSPKGHHILAYNSSRIYVIDVRGPTIEVKRELKILRRPVSTCVKDDGKLLTVLSTEMQVDVYDLEKSPPRRLQSIVLDHSPRTTALSPCGSVLAAAYEGGIEVTSLNPGAVATDRRAVKCDGVDSLAFSFDGTQLLGTTIHSSPSNTVILTAPYYDPGSHMTDDNISALWTTSILFPNTSRDCSHAVLIQDSHQEEASWTFTYDRSFETFRAVRIDDLRNGTTYFTGPIPNKTTQGRLLPCTLPAASYHGELVSAGFQGKEVWIYGVPDDLDAIPDGGVAANESVSSNGVGRRNSGPPRPAPRLQESGADRVPQWQLLCDKLRNTFVGGCKVTELEGVSNVKWVADFGDSSSKERLVIAARGVMAPKPITEEDDVDFIDGGRITLLDFDYGLADGETSEYTIEVGTKEPEVLEEEQRDLATEVAIVRRRTVAQKRGGKRSSLLRTATSAASRANPAAVPAPPPPVPKDDDDDDPLVPRRVRGPSAGAQPPTPAADDADTASLIDEQEALDAPYSHASPRSGTTLRRAATAAAVNRRLHPQANHIEYRRADGRREHPHESDADNWVPPPPPYQKEDPGDLPAFLRHTAVGPGGTRAGEAAPPKTHSAEKVPESPPRRTQTTAIHASRSPNWVPQPHRTNTVAESQDIPFQTVLGTFHQRMASDSTTMTRPRRSDVPRPMSSPSIHTEEDLYDVSPPDSPRLAPTQLASSLPDSTTALRPVSAMSPTPNVYTGAPNIRASYSNPLALNPPLLRPQTDSRAQEHRDRAPALDLQIPSPTFSNLRWSRVMGGSEDGPAIRRLSNSQTWPAGPSTEDRAAAAAAGFPYSAPPVAHMPNNLPAALPPAPRPDQLASLNTRGDQSPSARRLSGGFNVPRVPVGSRGVESSRHHGPPPTRPGDVPSLDVSPPPPPPPPPDQPLIISTPTGVSGAFDPPTRQTSGRRAETPLLAPVPRHPRPVPGAGPNRPTVERLETIYSVASSNGQAATNNGLPSWLNGPSASSARQSSVHRRQSRARRSASRNVRDAKRRGWAAKKKKKPRADDYEVASSSAWTDISGPPGQQARDIRDKDKKCIVM